MRDVNLRPLEIIIDIAVDKPPIMLTDIPRDAQEQIPGERHARIGHKQHMWRFRYHVFVSLLGTFRRPCRPPDIPGFHYYYQSMLWFPTIPADALSYGMDTWKTKCFSIIFCSLLHFLPHVCPSFFRLDYHGVVEYIYNMDAPNTNMDTSNGEVTQRSTIFRTPLQLERNLGLWVDRLGHYIEYHRHALLRLLGLYAAVNIKKGDGIFTFPPTGEIQVTTGDVFFLFPDTPHRYIPFES